MHDRYRNPFRHNILFLFSLLLIAAAAQPAPAATRAGRVVFATGGPVAVNASGASRSLSRGADVFAGDTLKTGGKGRLQVSFIDGAYVSVQPDSEYKIEEYRFSGKQDGTESAVSRLVKGGIRAVTGLIGKEHHDTYKVHTSAATIGIRGTGFSTRICQGDCPGKADGLYHNTWEGITYVFNNVDSVEIPAGRGVYVRDMNTPIQFLSQPPVVTAVRTGRELEEEQKDEEDQSRTIAAGDQRNDQGLQSVIVGDNSLVPTPSRVLLNQKHVGTAPAGDSAAAADIFSGNDTTVFANDSGFIGLLTSERRDGGRVRTVGTIDPAALLGADDDGTVSEVQTLLALADSSQLTQLLADPAAPAESTVNPVGLAWGRWSNGHYLVFDEDGHSRLDVLSDYQSVHFIFGPEPPALPAEGRALYEFTGGTRSTSVSGASIGDGITGGFIGVDFAASDAFITMDVNHADSPYTVDGELAVDPASGSLFNQPQGVFASTPADGSACNPQCPVQIDGGFNGPGDGSGRPGNISIAYDIMESDIITGVGGFHLFPTTASTVSPGMGTVAVAPADGGFASVTGGDGFGFVDAEGQPVGALYTPYHAAGGRVLDTIDPDAVLGGDLLDAVSGAARLYARADQSQVDYFRDKPASVAEAGSFNGIGWGRWADGRILSLGSGGMTHVAELTGNQSLHFIYGQEPEVIPETGSAYYGLAGGTRSTSASGETIGNGAVYGSLSADFGTDTGYLYMSVDHNGSNYSVNSQLLIDPAGNRITGMAGTAYFYNFSPNAIDSNCLDGCDTSLSGRFFGPMDPVSSAPGQVGLEYEIQEVDPISGVAVFSSTAPLLD